MSDFLSSLSFLNKQVAVVFIVCGSPVVQSIGCSFASIGLVLKASVASVSDMLFF